MKKLEKNWKKWKEDRQIDENKYLKRIEERKEEEKEKKWMKGTGGQNISPEEKSWRGGNVKITESGLSSFLLSFSFLFSFHKNKYK